MSHHKTSDCLAGQLLLPLAIRFDECPLRRPLNQASTAGKCLTNSLQAICRLRRTKAGRLFSRNISRGRKTEVTDIHDLIRHKEICFSTENPKYTTLSKIHIDGAILRQSMDRHEVGESNPSNRVIRGCHRPRATGPRSAAARVGCTSAAATSRPLTVRHHEGDRRHACDTVTTLSLLRRRGHSLPSPRFSRRLARGASAPPCRWRGA